MPTLLGMLFNLAFIASTAIALSLSAVLYSCPNAILRLLGTPEEILPMAREYLLWFIPTCILIMIQIVGEFVIRLDGSTKYAMCANIIPAVLNIVLDYLFIFICHWGLMGAALATTAGTGIGASMTLCENLAFGKMLGDAGIAAFSVICYISPVVFNGFLDLCTCHHRRFP